MENKKLVKNYFVKENAHFSFFLVKVFQVVLKIFIFLLKMKHSFFKLNMTLKMTKKFYEKQVSFGLLLDLAATFHLLKLKLLIEEKQFLLMKMKESMFVILDLEK